MNCKSIGLLFSIVFLTNTLAQESFYKTDEIREIKISFYQSNWDALLDSLYIIGDRDRILANVLIDGVSYDSVGVRYKGFSSASINRVKNPFNIKLNYTIAGQNHLGIDKLKLSNVIQDPSFVREVLSYEIIRQYMPTSEANYANVFINDTLIGLYSNVEAVNKEFLEKHFSFTDNVLVKGNPEEVDLYGENSNLSNSPGTDTLSYSSLYSMKSDSGWGELYNLIDTLNIYPHALGNLLNIDRTLWMHALNYTLVNFDSYIGYAQNYYLYQDDNGLFNPIIWDLNMSFGSFRLADASVYYDGFSIEQAKTIDPLSHYNEYSVYPRPLLRNLFEMSRYRKMYMAHIRTIVEENFENDFYKNRAEELYELIDSSVLADTNKFYSYTDFQDNLYSTVNDLVDYPGIVDLMEGRINYLSSYPAYQGAPQIDSIIYQPQEPISGDTILITSYIEGASEVVLAYRTSPNKVFEKFLMNDSGLYGDQFAYDHWFTGKVVSQGSSLDYYIYAENDSSGVFSPERAAYEYHTIKGAYSIGDLVINELMASNSSTVKDGNDEFDDWIELYNTTENDISLVGLFLSDDKSNLTKWALPEMSIHANDYFIVWADSEEGQVGVHSNFNLSSFGEQLFLSDKSEMIIDSITFESQLEDISFGRFPNGTGDFALLSPTFNASNNTASHIPEDDILLLNTYPNPVDQTLYINMESQKEFTLQLIDILGRVIYTEEFSAGIFYTELSIGEYLPGVYLITLNSENSSATQYIVKQ